MTDTPSPRRPASPPSAPGFDAQLLAAAQRIRQAVDFARLGLVDRDVQVDLVALAAVAREHLLIIGPPATAKSAAVRRVALALGGRYVTETDGLLWRVRAPEEEIGNKVCFRGAATMESRGRGKRVLIWDERGRLVGLDLGERRKLADLRL